MKAGVTDKLIDFSKINTILFDGDGVLWNGEDKIQGVDQIFSIIHKYNLKWALLTNNNTKTVQNYIDKLNSFGIAADSKNIYSSSTITANYLIRRYGFGAPIFVLGMPGLIETMQNAGFQVYYGETQPIEEIKAVVAGMDRDITHSKIKVAMRLILEGAEFVATNTDSSYPTPEGIHPGTGMVIGALIGTTEIKPKVIGKPSSEIFTTSMELIGANHESTVMIGDRLNTDIIGAQNAGIKSILVLTGVTTSDILSNSAIQPDVVFLSIKEVALALKEALND
jgi:4-nitrophenyl phosphatase